MSNKNYQVHLICFACVHVFACYPRPKLLAKQRGRIIVKIKLPVKNGVDRQQRRELIANKDPNRLKLLMGGGQRMLLQAIMTIDPKKRFISKKEVCDP